MNPSCQPTDRDGCGLTATILIAGVGNVLRGDDGFGVIVAQRLQQCSALPAHAKVIETGIGGMSLVQELMIGYDALLLLDAFQKNNLPGTLYFIEPELPDLSHLSIHELRDYFADTHYATPVRALHLLARLDKLPQVVRILGCEPENCDTLCMELSQPVAAAVDRAVIKAIDWVSTLPPTTRAC